MSDREKFLTEAIAISRGWLCVCKNNHPLGCYVHPSEFPDFETWNGFGRLWGWASEQEWWFNFKTMHYLGMIPEINPEISIIHPDRFATAIYEYLNPKETP